MKTYSPKRMYGATRIKSMQQRGLKVCSNVDQKYAATWIKSMQQRGSKVCSNVDQSVQELGWSERTNNGSNEWPTV